MKSLIFDPEKETLRDIYLDGTRIGFFLLGKKQILFLGEKMPDIFKECITLTITQSSAELDNFFLYEEKPVCTSLPSSIFFKFFDVVLPAIGITELKLIDASYKPLKFCMWTLYGIGFFTTGNTYYERYGFKNWQHDTLEGKKKISELRRSVTLNDLYKDSPKRLKEIYKKFKSIYELNLDKEYNLFFLSLNKDKSFKSIFKFKENKLDKFKKMLLNDFLLNYVKPFCELNTVNVPMTEAEIDKFLDTFFDDIELFLKNKGFDNREFIKNYHSNEEYKLKITTENPNKINIITDTEAEVGGSRSKHKKTKHKKTKHKKTKKTKIK